MNEEIDAIGKNNTCDLVDLQADKTCIGVKQVYKTKLNEKGKVERSKARLVAKRFAQQPSVNYGETFTPAVRLYIVRKVLIIALQNSGPI